MRQRITAAVMAGLLAATGTVVATSPAEAAPKTYKTCAALNKDYPHGVGRKGAKDKVRGTTKPVTNFKRNNALYEANKGRDRDKDKIACEKR
ncbi:excalibur calcium-binding domain-containing protein [Actinoplanes sp. NPDC049802]|uniref:excalibur calcium-binding domain-containing protein n=1 Tax=Actinoplanes sp. NPDC049802 TaxID=3154742 RepID=UPI0033D02AED